MEYIALSVLGENQPNLVNELAKVISHCECDILDCRIQYIGSQFSANMLIAGQWNAIAKLENQLAPLEAKFGLHLTAQRTKPFIYPKDYLPYIVYIIAQDKAGTLYELTNFFNELSILIDSIGCETYAPRQTGSRMFSLTMSVSVPSSLLISDLRERFVLFCDRLNLDGVMEPDKA
jgi:glycine cleavage system transcriptional repressor